MGAIVLLFFSLGLGLAIITPSFFWMLWLNKKADKMQKFYDLSNINGNPIASGIYGGCVFIGVSLFMAVVLGSIILGSFL